MKLWGHFYTITRHRHQVIRNCFKAGIGFQGLFHDLSKYSPREFFVGARGYQGNRSPNEWEREQKGYSSAWLHHKGRNRHHFEYWTDYNPAFHRVMPVKMPKRYVAEMFCDRLAASQVYQGKKYTDAFPLQYFLRGKQNRFIHKDTSDLLESWLTTLAEQGQDATFARIRAFLQQKGEY